MSDAPKQFLGANVDAHGNDGAVRVSMRAYTERMAEECLGKPAEQCRRVATPNKSGLLLEVLERLAVVDCKE